MASMNVSVPEPMRDWVQSRIESGKYASVSDYVRDLIRRDQSAAEEAVDQERWLASVDAAIERGMADLAAGRTHAPEDVRKELTARYAAKAKEREAR